MPIAGKNLSDQRIRGVGSILNQLAHWAGLEVYATASPKNFEWLKKQV